ncbi:MarR family transcriptional regulator [Rhodococcus sp. X156]|uniref:MarR family winged helix-turn-helix transcriptional regulator n=1 Tax=Rhodococcus sp. X156 TaxID=2499145 RepID=UPI000FDB76D7|nr:MarR family transcriptional regulator [Rhodococcus sp. X156]
MRAWRAFIQGSQRLLEALNRELSEAHGLTLADYRILVILSETEGNSVRMSDLADGIVSSRSRLTHQVRRLEEAGLVRREECPDDRRGILATLTAEGRRQLEEAAPTHLAGVRAHLIDQLDAAELRTMAEVLERADSALVREARGPD